MSDAKEVLVDVIFQAVNVPRIDERGTIIGNVPARFRLVQEGTRDRYEVEDVDLVTNRARFQERMRTGHGPDRFIDPPKHPPIYLTRAEIEYALEHRQFARIGTDDTLARVARTPKRGRKRR